jgi:hypothetical protein
MSAKDRASREYRAPLTETELLALDLENNPTNVCVEFQPSWIGEMGLPYLSNAIPWLVKHFGRTADALAKFHITSVFYHNGSMHHLRFKRIRGRNSNYHAVAELTIMRDFSEARSILKTLNFSLDSMTVKRGGQEMDVDEMWRPYLINGQTKWLLEFQDTRRTLVALGSHLPADIRQIIRQFTILIQSALEAKIGNGEEARDLIDGVNVELARDLVIRLENSGVSYTPNQAWIGLWDRLRPEITAYRNGSDSTLQAARSFVSYCYTMIDEAAGC